MKKYFFNFLLRGMVAAGFGPLVLAILYIILHRHAGVEVLTVNQVCIGIFSITLLAFIAGGMNFIYKIERMPLMVAILIHGTVLYISYLATYLVNDWLELGVIPIIVFSAIFVFGYIVIWAVIYSIMRKNTLYINKKINQKRQIEKA